MSKDTPPHIVAMFDQQEKAQQEEDALPAGVIAQVRIRRGDVGDEYEALAASFVTDLRGVRDVAAVLIVMEEVASQFASDLARRLALRAMESPEGALEAFEIVQTITAARKTKNVRVVEDE